MRILRIHNCSKSSVLRGIFPIVNILRTPLFILFRLTSPRPDLIKVLFQIWCRDLFCFVELIPKNKHSWAQRKLSPLSPLNPLNILLSINGPLLS